jgi:hypothetical protein
LFPPIAATAPTVPAILRCLASISTVPPVPSHTIQFSGMFVNGPVHKAIMPSGNCAAESFLTANNFVYAGSTVSEVVKETVSVVDAV